MDIAKVKSNLPNRNIVYYKSIDSTQNESKELLKKSVPDGTVVIADDQTKGMGTHGRTWHTNDNSNILMTLIYFPNCNIQKTETLTIDIAKCIVEVLEKMCDVKLSIKEPNDILFNNKKLGGILTEAITCKDEVKTILIGIGLNINQEVFHDEIKDVATSLKKETNRDFDREEIIINILNRIDTMYLGVRKNWVE